MSETGAVIVHPFWARRRERALPAVSRERDWTEMGVEAGKRRRSRKSWAGARTMRRTAPVTVKTPLALRA